MRLLYIRYGKMYLHKQRIFSRNLNPLKNLLLWVEDKEIKYKIWQLFVYKFYHVHVWELWNFMHSKSHS